MKEISMKQVYIREEFAQKAKLMAAIEKKSLQVVLDTMLAFYFEKAQVKHNGE